MKYLALLPVFLTLPAGAEPAGAPLAAAFGVELQKPAGDNAHFQHGSGVFLGGGLILTAAHVVTINPQDPDVTVVMDGWATAAKVAAIAPNGLDIALLKIDPSEVSARRKDLAPPQICTNPTTPHQPVVVVSEGKVSFSVTIEGKIETPTLKGDWTDILSTGYMHGASGGGVFDASQGCLAGIIIIGTNANLTQFVPAAKIAPFLAAFPRYD